MEENKSKYEGLKEYMKKIQESMKLSDSKQNEIDELTKKLYEETRIMMVEKEKEEIKTKEAEKTEFDEMTTQALLNAKKDVLTLKQSMEKDYIQKLLETQQQEKAIHERFAKMIQRDPTEEMLNRLKQSRDKALETLKVKKETLQKEHENQVKNINSWEKDIEKYAIKLEVLDKVEKVRVNVTPTPTTPVSTPTMPASTPTTPVSTPTTPVSTPTTPVSTPTMPVSTPTTPVSTPTVPASTPTTPVSTPTVPASTPTMPVSTPTTPVSTPTVPASTPTTPKKDDKKIEIKIGRKLKLKFNGRGSFEEVVKPRELRKYVNKLDDEEKEEYITDILGENWEPADIKGKLNEYIDRLDDSVLVGLSEIYDRSDDDRGKQGIVKKALEAYVYSTAKKELIKGLDVEYDRSDISKVNIPIISKVFKGQMSRKQKNYINYMSQKTSNYTNHVGIYTKNPIKRFLEDRKTKKLPSVTRTTEQNEEFIRRLSSTQPISLDPDRNKTPEQIAQENARQEARNRMTSESRENSGSER